MKQAWDEVSVPVSPGAYSTQSDSNTLKLSPLAALWDSRQSPTTPTRSKGVHLCVFVHGLWGKPAHLNSVVQHLQRRYSEKDGLHILVSKRNSDNYTYDGIEVGGERVAQEIENELHHLKARGTPVGKLSLVGYSLGGLIARYTVGLLYSRGWFNKVQPVTFTAFASPFLGVRAPTRGYGSHVWNAVAPRMLSTSGRQLFLIDDFRDSGRSLLEILADPRSIFMAALRRFKKRTLYANIVNDTAAPWYTTSISRSNPFEDLELVQLNYMPGYTSVLLDPVNPVQPKNGPPQDFYKRIVNNSSTFLQRLPSYALYSILTPIGLTAFAFHSGIESVRSCHRIQLHNTTGTFQEYRIPIVVAAEEAAACRTADSKVLCRQRSLPAFPLLELDPRQFQMIEALNDLGWNKHPVYISKVRHSHAAIIVRHGLEAFDEGWTVIRHWVEHEFEL